MKKITLQWRITILTALVLIVCTVTLTMISMYNAGTLFVPADDYNGIDYIYGPEIEMGEEPSQAPLEVARQEFNWKSIIFCSVFSLLGTAAVYFSAGRALKPLRNLSNQISTIDENNLDVTLPKVNSKDEVGQLANGFNQMLARLNDAFVRQKRFTANAAHELKTPLATLKTGVQVLEADKSAEIEDYKEHNKYVLESTDRLSNIVDDLLILASCEEGVYVSKEEIMLEPFFYAVVNEFASRLKQREMKCQIHCGDLFISANPDFIYRIYYNLFDNACKYGRQCGNIYIDACKNAKGTTVVFRDDGSGIAKEHLPYIFDAFYRADKSRSREMGGSGLGLSIVKAMVDACGGTISVESDETIGTCFTVYFPNF